jgi:hypothetical protein
MYLNVHFPHGTEVIIAILSAIVSSVTIVIKSTVITRTAL